MIRPTASSALTSGCVGLLYPSEIATNATEGFAAAAMWLFQMTIKLLPVRAFDISAEYVVTGEKIQ